MYNSCTYGACAAMVAPACPHPCAKAFRQLYTYPSKARPLISTNSHQCTRHWWLKMLGWLESWSNNCGTEPQSNHLIKEHRRWNKWNKKDRSSHKFQCYKELWLPTEKLSPSLALISDCLTPQSFFLQCKRHSWLKVNDRRAGAFKSDQLIKWEYDMTWHFS